MLFRNLAMWQSLSVMKPATPSSSALGWEALTAFSKATAWKKHEKIDQEKLAESKNVLITTASVKRLLLSRSRTLLGLEPIPEMEQTPTAFSS